MVYGYKQLRTDRDLRRESVLVSASSKAPYLEIVSVSEVHIIRGVNLPMGFRVECGCEGQVFILSSQRSLDTNTK